MTLSRTPILLAAAFAATLVAASGARAEEFDDARTSLLQEIVLRGNALDRGKRIKQVSDYDDAAAARALLEALDLFVGRWNELEDEAARTREDYQKYSGFSFHERGEWAVKQRLLQKMEHQDELLRADSAVAQMFSVAFVRMSDSAALSELERHVGKSPIAKSRRLVFGGLLRNERADVGGAAAKAMKDSDPEVRLAALLAFAERKDPAFVPLAVKALAEKGWPHRQAAARALGFLGSLDGVLPLINAMAVEDGRLVEDYAAALTKLVGEPLGPYPDVWKQWWDDHKDELAAKGAAGGAAKAPKGLLGPPVNYYGIQTRSKRVVFIIDISGSMKEPIGATPDRVVTGESGSPDEKPTGPKIDVAKSALRQALVALPEDCFFNVVFFNHQVRLFSEKGLIQAKPKVKSEVYLILQDLEPSGATWTYGALKACFEMAGRGAEDKAYDPAVDTIFLLSDGAPTDSDIAKAQPMEGQVILDAVAEWNRLKRVQIHTIAIDPRIGKGSFVRFMKSLAHQNDGLYTEIGD